MKVHYIFHLRYCVLRNENLWFWGYFFLQEKNKLLNRKAKNPESNNVADLRFSTIFVEHLRKKMIVNSPASLLIGLVHRPFNTSVAEIYNKRVEKLKDTHDAPRFLSLPSLLFSENTSLTESWFLLLKIQWDSSLDC